MQVVILFETWAYHPWMVVPSTIETWQFLIETIRSFDWRSPVFVGRPPSMIPGGTPISTTHYAMGGMLNLMLVSHPGDLCVFWSAEASAMVCRVAMEPEHGFIKW